MLLKRICQTCLINRFAYLDGIGLAYWIAEHRPGLPVVLISGSILGLERLSGLQVEFLRKPFSLETSSASVLRAVPGKMRQYAILESIDQ